MRQHLAVLAFALSVGGCSIIYNPGNIKEEKHDAAIDGPPDAPPIDADPSMLTLADVYPSSIYEGAGTGGSRAAVFVIRGTNFIGDATVTVSPANRVTVASTQVSTDSNSIAVTLVAPVDPSLHDGTSIPLTLRVSQRGGSVTKTLDPSMFSIVGLEELTIAPTTTPLPKALYSKIDIASGISFTGAHPARALFRSVSYIKIAGTITADATGATAGPGGCGGGANSVDGAAQNAETPALDCIGKGHAVNGGLLNGAGGGGAGFSVAGDPGGGSGGAGGIMNGDPRIASYAMNIPSGGGGGAPNTTLGGGAGGGGGGIVEVTAAGDLTFMGAGATTAVSANGAQGGDGAQGGGGGGGAGGVVLLRSNGTISAGVLSAARGIASGGGNAGGQGSPGRTRVDAAHGTVPTGTNRYIGPMLVDAPAVLTTKTTTLMVSGTPNTSDSVGRVYDRMGAVQGAPFTPNFGATGMAMPAVTLVDGYNKVCVTVASGNPSDVESTNCAEIVVIH